MKSKSYDCRYDDDDVDKDTAKANASSPVVAAAVAIQWHRPILYISHFHYLR